MPRINKIFRFIRAHVAIYCPEDEKQMLELKYMDNQVLYCPKCEKVYELVLRNSKITKKQLKDDGWLQS